MDYGRAYKHELDTLSEKGLPEDIATRLREYMDDLAVQGTSGLSVGRKYAYLLRLRRVALMIPDKFLDPSERDIKQVMATIQNSPVKWGNGDPHKPSLNQIQSFQVCLKKFYKWHLGNNKVYPACVDWIKINNPRHLQEKPVEIIAKEEHLAMYNAAKNARDKALLSLLYDSGCRIGELLTMRIRDCQFDDDGALIAVTGKTGYRQVRIVGNSIADLQVWIANHPLGNNPEATLFTRTDGKSAMDYDQVHSMFRKTQKRAGIQRRIYPHLYRHTRATMLADKVPESVLEKQQGWVHGSRMSRVYVHLSQEQQDSAILQAYGKKRKKPVEIDVETPKKCPRCQNDNRSDAKFCKYCWLNFDIAEIERKVIGNPAIDELTKKMLNSAGSSDSETVTRLVNLLVEIITDPAKLEKFRAGMESGTKPI